MLIELRKQAADLPGSVTLPAGRNRWIFRYRVDGKLQKRTFATEEEALTAKIEAHESKKMNGQNGILTAEEVRLAITMFQMVGDRDPLDVIRQGLNGQQGKVGGRVIDAVEEYLIDFQARVDRGSASPATMHTKKFRVNAFAASPCGVMKLGEVKEEDVLAYLKSGPWAPVTQEGYRRDVAGFYSWCVSEKKLSADLNPMKEVKSFELPDTQVEYLNAEQLEKLLLFFEENDPGIIPFVVLGAFAGIRTAEIARLIACDAHEHLIRFDEKQIFLPKHVVKPHRRSRKARLLENLPPALWKWLEAYPSMSSKTYVERIRNGKKACGIPNINSFLRHSYITNAVAMFESVDRVMLHSGHIESGTLIHHYKGICEKKDGEAYFAIEPSDTPKSVVSRDQRKLDLGKARSIRYRVADGEKKVDLAAEYGVSEALIRQVVKGEKWAE